MTANRNPRSLPLFFFVLLSGMVLLLLATQILFAQPTTETDEPDKAAAVGAVCDLTVDTVGMGNVSATKTSVDPDLKYTFADDWSEIVLENSQLKVRFTQFESLNHGVLVTEFAITDFIIKGDGQNQVKDYLDADPGRGRLLGLDVVQEAGFIKASLEWQALNGGSRIKQDYTLYANAPFLKVDYRDLKNGLLLVDLASPGGKTLGGKHVAYGGDSWIRPYITFEDPDYADIHGSYYNRYPDDDVNDPTDGGSLNYNGNFIFANYNPTDGNGYGRVLPVNDVSIIKLLLTPGSRLGFEWYIHPFYLTHQPFTGYIYAVTGGAEEAIEYGKRLADSGGTDFGYNCGDVVTLTANPDPNYKFDGWSGDVTGTDNPAQLTLTGKHEVTANFSADVFTMNITTVPGDGSGGTVNVFPQKAVYDPGEVVQITAVPNSCWDFAGWSGDASGTQTVQNITMDAPKYITANFSQEEFTINVTPVGDGTVQISPSKSKYVNCEDVTITAVGGPSNTTLLRWGGDLSPYNATNPLHISVTSNINARALFGYQNFLPIVQGK